MGGFHWEKIKNVIDDNYTTVVETGTHKGIGTTLLSNHFEKIYTIEIDHRLFKFSEEKFKNNENIICLHGDSKEIIYKLTDELNESKNNIVFWLDAHWSGDNSVDWQNSKWKGYGFNTGYIGEATKEELPTGHQQVPLEGEILNIYQNIKNECVLYIDDFDKICPKTLKGLKNKCFVGEDWSHLDFNKIFQTIEDRLLYKEIRGHQCILKFKKID